MGHDDVYIHLRRIDPGYHMERGLARAVLDQTGMSIPERIRVNFSREVWKTRWEYIKYSALDFFYKTSFPRRG